MAGPGPVQCDHAGTIVVPIHPAQGGAQGLTQHPTPGPRAGPQALWRDPLTPGVADSSQHPEAAQALGQMASPWAGAEGPDEVSHYFFLSFF